MSRLYQMEISISKFNDKKTDEIEEAANNEWEGLDKNFDIFNSVLNSYSKNYLCGGEDEEEFTERITKAIWKANGAFCVVNVKATFLESLPFDEHELDEEDYNRFIEDEKEVN